MRTLAFQSFVLDFAHQLMLPQDKKIGSPFVQNMIPSSRNAFNLLRVRARKNNNCWSFIEYKNYLYFSINDNVRFVFPYKWTDNSYQRNDDSIGDKFNNSQNLQNWVNLATEMNDNDTAHILEQNNPGNISRFWNHEIRYKNDNFIMTELMNRVA